VDSGYRTEVRRPPAAAAAA